MVAITRAAEVAVDSQRANVEMLVKAKRTQDQEEALWIERVGTATTAQEEATQAKMDADGDVATAEEQVTVRSWLFKVLNFFSSTAFADNCDTGGNGLCAYMETQSGAGSVDVDASLSLWAWPSAGNCDYTDNGAKLCPILGISGSGAGLIQSATTALGAVRDGNTAPTELYSAYETADYEYVSSSTTHDFGDGNGSVNSSKLLIALDLYQTWQKALLMSEMMKTACWTLAGANFVDGDEKSTWCHFNNADQTGNQHFHPLI